MTFLMTSYSTKSLLALPLLMMLFVGVSHALYLCGLSVLGILVGLEHLPHWSLFGWGIADDLPGWLLLMAVTFTLGLWRSRRADVAAWLLCCSFPLTEAILFRQLPLPAIVAVAGVQLIGTLMGCAAWLAGWWIRGRKEGVAKPGSPGRGRVLRTASLWLLVICFSTYGWWGISVNTFQVARPGELSDFESIVALVVPEGATNVSRTVAPDKSLHVAYGLTQQYPAMEVIEQTSAHLERLGWEPLEFDWMNPTLPSSHVDGWSELIDATQSPPSQVHRWQGQWRDAEGNVVGYSYTYRYPFNGAPDLTSLWVNASWHLADAAKRFGGE